MTRPARSLQLALYLSASARSEQVATRLLDRRLGRGKEDAERLQERLGHAALPRPEGPLVWFHAASVGEAAALLELLRRIAEARPDVTLLLTTGTVSSAAVVAGRLPPTARHQFVPVDARPAVQRFLRHWRPDLAVWAESELWPALIFETHGAGVPMLLVNARMSARSFRRWRFSRGMARGLLGRFDLVLAQDAVSAGFLRRLGVADDRIDTIGTLKEGAAPLPHDEAERARMAGHIGSRPVWLAASTHPGEEALVAAALHRARRSAPGLLLILAPRHPERGAEIAATLIAEGWRVARRGAGEVPDAETDIYLADTLGEMGLWYRLAPVTLVGGSFAEGIGGHNPFEPAALGSAILTGPATENFADAFARLEAAGAVVRVPTPEALDEAVTACLEPDRAARLARAAWDATSEGALVTERVLSEIIARLPAAP
ncbi:MAG: 3-deoxy-D-manno-octulosonic acid transferase [Pseudomonadota bacterium]